MFQCFNDLKRFSVWCSKKIESLGNSDNRADQITGENDNNALGILWENFELKHVYYMFIVWSYVHSLFQFGAIINRWMKWVFLLRNQYIAFCVFRTLWFVSHTLLLNACTKLNVETLYWYADCGQRQQ